ncbi:MAG: crotonase [Proteobacteria bacterium]|nr:MAG: crotonase [Pseudomonadota bacterium]
MARSGAKNATKNHRRYWALTFDDDAIAWLAINCPGQSTNTFSAAVLEELSGVVDELNGAPPRGLVVYSTKASGFIVGADIREFKHLSDPLETTKKMTAVHELFARIEEFAFPSVARIHGFCLGGGLELALACRYRVALDDQRTRIGLPEILLGIHPGFGGTVRSIERIGVLAAMDLMLTGRSIDARRAVKLGLIDSAVPERHLDHAVRALIMQARVPRGPGYAAKLANTRLLRPVVARILRRQVSKRAQESHYPAPFALIRQWAEHGGSRRELFRAEARSIGQLLASTTSQNLQRLYFLTERLKSMGRDTQFQVRHVHVIGAGTMGGDIAAWCAMRGMHVTLQDQEIKYLAPAIKRATATYKSRIRDPYHRASVQDNLVADLDGVGIARADVIIEAIIEDLDAKRGLFQQIERRAKAGALIATNTSSIPLEDIAQGMRDGTRLVGIHFFNPVAKMQLIEIINAPDTDPLQCARAAAFAIQIDRQPLPARSSPGFLINRILSPYLQEAMTMVDEGICVVDVDETATQFGMPMGPIELADTIGLDICLSVGEVLSEKLGGAVPGILRAKVGQGHLGRKNKIGFYKYKGSRIIRPKGEQSDRGMPDLCDRLILRLLNESVACLREGVVADADLIDVGMVFGTGFAPFRGGPIHYAAHRGIDNVHARLEQLQKDYGDRFEPDAGWKDLQG